MGVFLFFFCLAFPLVVKCLVLDVVRVVYWVSTLITKSFQRDVTLGCDIESGFASSNTPL